MKTIPQAYEKNGYAYQLVERTPKWAVYAQRFGKRIVAFELVKVRHQAGREASWGTVEPGEYLPSTEEWGRIAWTISVQGVGETVAKSTALDRMYALNKNSEPPTAKAQA